MKRKTNVLYVWGYNGSPDSSSVTNLKQVLGKEYNVISDYYAQYNPKEAITDINYYIKTHNIDILVGSSLGGYLALQIPNIKKVIINPCLHPEVELELLKDENGEPCVPQHIVDFYKDYIKEHDVWEAFTNNDDTVFIMGTEDELLGTKYVDEVKEHSSNVNLVNQGHHNTKESIEEFVVPVIKSM
jgi:predicted esterase YcpF (UPF0227 family)